MAALSAHLRRLRQEAGLTQAQLAERSGLTTDAVAAIERGLRRHPYPNTVSALAAALDLPIEERVRLSRLAMRPRPPHEQAGAVEAGRALPQATLPLIGREAEIRAILALLRKSHAPSRLVTSWAWPSLAGAAHASSSSPIYVTDMCCSFLIISSIFSAQRRS